MNIAGKQRLLAALPTELLASTTDSLEQADVLLDVIEGAEIAGLLRHDLSHAATLILIEELKNHVSVLNESNAATRLSELAANPRYSTLLASDYGDSIRARFNVRDDQFFRRIARESLAVNGTASQRRHAAALAEVPKLRRALGLAVGSRDAAVQALKQPSAPNPSEALR